MKVLLVFLISLVSFSKPIEVYFNNDPQFSYTDPYRKIKKPGVDFEGLLVKAIDKSKSSIGLAVQELNLTYLAKSLVKAHRRGVKVRVIVEDSYNKTLYDYMRDEKLMADEYWQRKIKRQEFFLDRDRNGRVDQKELEAGDAIEILRQGKVSLIDDSVGAKKLMHHKFLVIDQKVTFVSSANFTRSGTHGDFDVRESIGNANAMIGVADINVTKKFLIEFEQMWSGRFKLSKNFRPLARSKVGSSHISVQFSPTNLKAQGWNNSVNGVIVREISTMKRSFAANLYVFSSQFLANALLEIRKRNQRIPLEVLVDFNFAIRSWSETLDMWGIQMENHYCNIEKDNRPWGYAEKGVGVPNLRKGDKLHHKFAVIDGRKVLFGSHNWSNSANTQNDETFMIIEDVAVAQAFLREHRRLMSRASLGVPAYLRKKMKDRKAECH